MFSSYVQYAHASVMTRARIASIKTRTMSVFLMNDNDTYIAPISILLFSSALFLICKSQLPLLEKKMTNGGIFIRPS